MAWDGYFAFDGEELINVERTEAYARALGATWLIPNYTGVPLAQALGDAPYLTPWLDDAPWISHADPTTAEFLGLYPLDIVGVEDSSRTAVTVQSSGDGGSVGRVRRGTKDIVFSAMLLATTERGAAHGLDWLETVLDGMPCDDLDEGSALCFLAAPPVYSVNVCPPSDAPPLYQTPTQQLDRLYRTALQAQVNSGPIVVAKRYPRNGAVWTVSFTVTVGVGFTFGQEHDIVSQAFDATVVDPYVSEVTGLYVSTPSIHVDVDCAADVYVPVYDPLCPALTPPPTPPSVALGCIDAPTTWERRSFTIPRQYVGLWASALPRVAIHGAEEDSRNVRVRFYADPLGFHDTAEDPCGFCADLLVSYVPAGSTLVIDSAISTIYLEDPDGSRRRADVLVSRSDGLPFDWPVLECGMGYVVTVDVPVAAVPPVVDLSVQARVA